MQPEAQMRRHEPTFIRTVSLGQLLILLGFLVSVIAWATTSAQKADTAIDDIKNLKTDLTRQISDLGGRLDSAVNNIQTQISTLPSEEATIGVLQQHAEQTDKAIGNLNEQIRNLIDTTISERAAIESLQNGRARQH